jgi:hypothetical protein
MYVTAQTLLRRRVMLRHSARNELRQNVSVRTDKGSIDYVDGFLDQMKRGIK